MTERTWIPPKAAAELARGALERRAKLPPSRRAMTATGLARARDLANRRPFRLETIREMAAWFARHAKTRGEDSSDPDSKWRQAWDGWGGDPAWRWARRIVETMDTTKTSAPTIKLSALARPALLEAHPTLPPLPPDRPGFSRYRRWMLVTDVDGFHAPNAEGEVIFHPVSPEWIDRQIAEFDRMIDGGIYHPPLQAEHSGAVTAGLRLGDVLQLARWVSPEGRLTLIAAVAFALPNPEDKIASGALRFVSPSFGDWTDERGREFRGVFLELSLTTRPQQVGKAPTHVLSADPGPQTQETLMEQQYEERLSAMEAKIDALMASMEKKKEEEDKEEEEVEMGAEPAASPAPAQLSAPASAPAAVAPEIAARLEALEKANKTLTLERDRAAFAAGFPVGAQVQLSADLVEACFLLHQAAPDAFAALAKVAQAPQAGAVVQLSAPAPAPAVPWAIKLSQGAGSEPADQKTVKLSALRQKAKDEGRALDAVYQEAVAAGLSVMDA